MAVFDVSFKGLVGSGAASGDKDDNSSPDTGVAAPVLPAALAVATGGSADAAITEMKKRGCHNIKLMVLVAAPEGIEHLQKVHPDVDIYVGAVDDHLNEHGYIVPGLGDAGDRIFGTK